MKRIICLITVLCLVLGSFSFSFAAVADWTTTDQQNLSNTASYLNTIKNYFGTTGSVYTLMQTMNTTLTSINNKLIYGGESIASIVDDIAGWMSPIFNAITNVPVDLNTIIGALGYTESGTYHPYLMGIRYLSQSLTNYSSLTGETWNSLYQAHNLLTTGNNSSTYTEKLIANNGTVDNSTWAWGAGSPIGNLALILTRINTNLANVYSYRWASDLTGYKATQNVINWGSLSTSTFTPQSVTDGLYKYLGSIQAPVARLSYVLASEERIEAQEAAAANEEAVVDNFIESSGAGSTSPSDIGSLSDLSSGYQDNFGSDASVTGIFNIFNSNNMGWFSQETTNQLDTSTDNRRGSSFQTPLLDLQINDIYDQIGVKHD